MAKNPKFTALLHEMAQLHDKKNADYASDGNPYSNFEEAAAFAEGFTGVDAVFAVLVGVKAARLRELTRSGKTPNNESVVDTRRDMAMYQTLWASYKLPWSYDDSRLWQNGGPTHQPKCECGTCAREGHLPDATGEPV